MGLSTSFVPQSGCVGGFTPKSLMSDLYIDELRDKTLRGLEGRAIAGLSTGGFPLGYRSDPERDSYGRTIGHRISVDEQGAKVAAIATAHNDVPHG
jgi:hypothetical protein